MPTTFYTEEEVRKQSRKVSALFNVLSRIEHAIGDKDSQNNGNALRKDGEYTYIPFSSHVFFDIMDRLASLLPEISARKYGCGRLKFLEIGCGFPIKMAIAYEYGFDVYGIEMSKSLVELSKHFFNKAIQCVNAFDFDKYGTFDVVYYYCPIANEKKERELELLIEKKVKIGTIIIPCLKKDYSYAESKAFEVLSKNPLIIRKVKEIQ